MIKLSLILATLALTLSSWAYDLQTIEVHAAKMDRKVTNTIILPEGYRESDARYSVLYLLHGFGDNHTRWAAATTIEELADQYQVIVVCPSVGHSWYFDSPINPKSQYESYIVDDLLPYCDANYRTTADRQHRALSGLSMGGHGSMYLAIRHRDLFSIAVPLSGGLDIRPFPDKWNIKKYLGDMNEYPENWDANTVVELAKDLKDGELAISVDCGSGDFFVEVNRAFKAVLESKGVAFEYQEHPGGHSWDYWSAAIIRQMPFIVEHFGKD